MNTLQLSKIEFPKNIVNNRIDNFYGDALELTLKDLPEDYQNIVLAFFNQMLEILKTLETENDLNVLQNSFISLNSSEKYKDLIKSLKLLKTIENEKPEKNELYSKVFHDLRGGAFASIHTTISIFKSKPITDFTAKILRFLVRDHLKIIRNIFSDLDVEFAIRDRQLITHSAELLKEKWSGVGYNIVSLLNI